MDAYVDDDGVTVEDESESFENEIPKSEIESNFDLVTAFVFRYQWHIFFTTLAIVVVFVKYLVPKYRNWQLEKEDEARTAQYNNDPELLRKRSEAMEVARRRLQDQHDLEAEKFREKQKEKEEAKRQEKITEWERHTQGKGYHSKYKAPEEQPASANASVLKKKPKLREEFNPLMGGEGSSRFRPNSRSCSSSGG